ncbi:MAG: LapD/MoxY N-terminal periplasmic domain-containing protein [Comamonadaceae bacterium]
MSLVKRLWLVVGLITLAAIICAAGTNMLYARRYFESEIKVKNLDTANSLAMSISQNASDTVMAELLVSSQFDLGHYQRIDYRGPDGKLIVHRQQEPRDVAVPGWFQRLMPLQPQAGVANLQAGWKQLGTIELQSDPTVAYDSLWQSAVTLSQLFLLGSVIICLLGTWVIRSIIRPLNRVVDQAEALAERRFIEIKPPGTLEFRLIVQAMNRFTIKTKKLLDDESSRLHQLKTAYEYDKLTGYLTREVFLRNVAAEKESQHTHEEGVLVLVRVDNLTELNSEIGRVQADHLLQELAGQLRLALLDQPKALLGRLNGAEFGILAPNQTDSVALLQRLHKQVLSAEPLCLLQLRYGSAYDGPHSKLSDLLSTCDQEMVGAGAEALVLSSSVSQAPGLPASQWGRILEVALQQQEISLTLLAVRGRDQADLHFEASARIHSSVAGNTLLAGAFLPWARRRHMAALVDQAILSRAIAMVDSHAHPICVNLGFESVCDEHQFQRIVAQLEQHQQQARHLYLDISEEIAFGHPAELQRFCERLRPTQCRIGIKNLNLHLGHLGRLHSLGLHHLKVSHLILKDLAQDSTSQAILRSLCTIAHTMGLQVIAKGATTTADIDLLFELGFDGITQTATV